MTVRLHPVVIAGVVSFLVFALFAAPGITWMDPGELAQAAYNLGGAHPPGHPGHSLLGKLATLVPIGEIAFRLNLLSAAAMACTIAGLVALMRVLLPSEPVAAYIGGGLAVFAPVVQTNAVRTEVYAEAAALLVWAMVACLSYIRAAEPRPHHALLCTLFCALAAAFQPLIAAAAAVPMAVALVLSARRLGRRIPVLASAAAALVLVGAAVYLYLPARASAATPPLLMWGDPGDWDGFFTMMRAAAYRDNVALTGFLHRFATLAALAGDGVGAGLFWGGLVGLGLGAATGLRCAGTLLMTAIALLLAAATQKAQNPDMPGYVLPALLFIGAGLGPLCGAACRMLPLPDTWQSGRVRQLVAAGILVPLISFALTAPTVRVIESGALRDDETLQLWDETLERMPPGPGVYFANSDASLFAAQYEQLVAGGRPDIAVANAELTRDRWFLAHLKRVLPALYVPYIDDGVRGSLAERLAVDNLRAGLPVASDTPGLGQPLAERQAPMGRAYRLALAPVPVGELARAEPPLAFAGGVGRRVSGRMALERALYEIERGRLFDAAVAVGASARFGEDGMRALQQQAAGQRGAGAGDAGALPEAGSLPRPLILFRALPAISPVFLYEAWQAAILADEIAWQAGIAPPERKSTYIVPEERLHKLWREILAAEPADGHAAPSGPAAPKSLGADALIELLTEIAVMGPDAEVATVRVLEQAGRKTLAERVARALVARLEGDVRPLLVLGSLLDSRSAPEALAEAEALFLRAAEIAPEDPEPLFRLGVTYAKQGKLAAASLAWQEALRRDPDRSDVAALLQRLPPPPPSRSP